MFCEQKLHCEQIDLLHANKYLQCQKTKKQKFNHEINATFTKHNIFQTATP